MRYAMIFFGMAMLLLAGCAQQAPQPPAQPEEPAMTCTEYCEQQPHIQCVGSWRISGTYPDCVCRWECQQEEEPPQMANPAAVNCDEKGYDYEIRDEEGGQAGYCSHAGSECEEWALFRGECCLADADCAGTECAYGTPYCSGQQCTCPAPQELPPVSTDKSVRELVDAALQQANDQFYSDIESGTFNITTFKWFLTEEQDPTGVPIGDAGVVGDMLFNEQEMQDVISFGFKLFQQTDGTHTEARGIGVFDKEPPLLKEVHEEGGTLEIMYRPPTPDKHLRDCTITDAQKYRQLENDDRIIWVYLFRCASVEDA